MTAQGCGVSFCRDNVLELGSSDGCTFVNIVNPLNCTI